MGPVNHGKTPAWPDAFGCLPDHILQGAEDFMACNRLWLRWILESVILIHIRRIAGHYIKRSPSEPAGGFLEIACDNFHLLRKAVEPDAPSRHLRHFLLDFQAGKMAPLG